MRTAVFLLHVDVFEDVVGCFHGELLDNVISSFNQKKEQKTVEQREYFLFIFLRLEGKQHVKLEN